MKKQTVLKKLAELKTPLLQYGVTRLGLFGSTVRGENKPGSDIDVLIDFQPEQETFQNFMCVCELLESIFKRQKLDIVTFKGLSPFVGQQILNEVEYVQIVYPLSTYRIFIKPGSCHSGLFFVDISS